MTLSATDIQMFSSMRANSEQKVSLEGYFHQTPEFLNFRKKVFSALLDRENKLKAGRRGVKGVGLVGHAGSGKTRMTEKVIEDYHQFAAKSEPFEFGSKIISVTVPGRATVRETMTAILKVLGYEVRASRDDDYLTRMVVLHLKGNSVAGLHLDEVQDVGRYRTADSRLVFLKRFRNLMQDEDWPVSLIMTGTPESKELFNGDRTLKRRLNLIEIPLLSREKDQNLVGSALGDILKSANVDDEGLLRFDGFLSMLMHAAAYRFGVAIEMAIEAIALCKNDGAPILDLEHFAEVYESRMSCDAELNPFRAEDWKNIDTLNAFQRYQQETERRRRSRAA